MNIHVIFTGGTISGVIEDGRISPGGDLQGRLGLQGQGGPRLTFEEPFRILSEDLDADHVLKLRDCVAGAVENCDGIIITHGTDTLHYTAALLQYIFCEIKIPVILVSSAYVLSDPRSNGKENLDAAIEYILEGGEAGVFVSYRNPSSSAPARIIPADRLLSSMTGSSDFYAYEGGSGPGPDIEPGGTFIEKLIYDSHGLGGFSVKDINLTSKSDMILRLAAYPGMCFNKESVTDRIRVVMIEGYHSGTLGVTDELKSFAAFCKQRQIPVLLSFVNSGELEYETVDGYRRAGIIPVYDIVPIVLYCRLWLIFSNFTEI